ncbi:Coenzyme F420 hydrogenase/dehydrogenase, beta subunit C-terminal domain [Caviibacterium pharyngocola]|uniref:4Fe-4S ferredoxin-type domain-containing protein n=1 Tax=Caviibacterium pharyngocola TaxID=28159 RepID=A0A2M8RX96_9PAST|nr:Coenzyme F420 hydrogenase/dehydrogenase, beta subunit C-terminal domain [Caviibacterium pharyngocola]PJG83511.1 hypothetical protein CVP04_03850 [Caviibacterium pharyngocola]
MNHKNVDLYKEYCTGCGLCSSILNVQFEKDEKGFSWPILSDNEKEFCEKVCPAGGNAYSDYTSPWGKYINLYESWANDFDIRNKASSGGTLTALCCYLLEHKLVDGIIQTKASSQVVYETETVISTTIEEVKACMGSRYSISSPLKNIKQIVENGKIYAFVGKPCDVASLRAYLALDPKLEAQIKYLLSFFCAGEPSDIAQTKLLNTLNCNEATDCISLQYRGNGWPGEAIAIKTDYSSKSISYDDSWGKILGRDVRHICRFCMDGIGESADVSCGDLWHLTPDNKPNFSEALGRNMSFARTQKGEELMQQATKAGYIASDITNEEQLKFVQTYQYTRRATMYAKLMAMKLMRRNTPDYNVEKMKRMSRLVNLKTQVRTALGILKRIYNKKI